MDDLAEAIAEWHGVGSRVAAIISKGRGLSGADLPRLPLGGLEGELRRARGAEIPPPLPRSLDPDAAPDDPTIRSIEAAVGPAD